MGGMLPVAEHFHSIQGEGQWVGTPMHFIRLAGCNVGRPATVMLRNNAYSREAFPILQTGAPATVCASWDGRTFWCDTDYNKHEEQTVTQLINDTWEKHICLTGGEPFLHERHFAELYSLAQERDIRIHVETSGTISPKFWPDFWVTCAPKIGAHDDVIGKCNELKLLVNPKFHPDELTAAMRSHPNVFLCPINQIAEVDQANVERCMMWLKQFPNWRLSCQLHKFLNMR